MGKDLKHPDGGGQVVDQLHPIESGVDDGRVFRLALVEANPTGGDVLAYVLQSAGRNVVDDDRLIALRQVRVDEMRTDEPAPPVTRTLIANRWPLR